MAHGNVYPAERVDAALANYFRVGNLTALRELALLWLADRVDEGLQRYKAEHDIDHVWEARERVVVALTGGPEGETLIRRASRVAQRAGNSACSPCTCSAPTGYGRVRRRPCARSGRSSRAWAAATTRWSATTSPRPCWSSPAAWTPRSWCIGTSRRARWARAIRGGIGGQVVADSGEIDVHIVTHGRRLAGVAAASATGALDRTAAVARPGARRASACRC